jgi:glycerol-3-phosphate dehydrogenase
VLSGSETNGGKSGGEKANGAKTAGEKANSVKTGEDANGAETSNGAMPGKDANSAKTGKETSNSAKTGGERVNGGEEHMSVYGTDAAAIEALMEREPARAARLVEWLPYTEAEVVWAVRCEMARTVDDVLARRLRILFLDAQAALVAAPRVAELMAMELGYDENWKRKQLIEFNRLAYGYLPAPVKN